MILGNFSASRAKHNRTPALISTGDQSRSGRGVIGEEFLGVIFRDDEDGELSYNFSMAILEMDLD